MLDHQEALISLMVLVSAADEHMSDRELNRMSRLVTELPVFTDFDVTKLPETAQKCAAILAKEEGVELLLAEVVAALPAGLRETAYAIACDVAAADGRVVEPEMEILEIIRHYLSIDQLIAAGIERGARARHARI